MRQTKQAPSRTTPALRYLPRKATVAEARDIAAALRSLPAAQRQTPRNAGMLAEAETILRRYDEVRAAASARTLAGITRRALANIHQAQKRHGFRA